MSWTRRDTLRALAGLPFAAALPACDAPPPAVHGDLLGPSMALGHRFRDGLSFDVFRDAPLVRADVVVVGGGPSGLAAARRLVREGIEDVRVLELEPSAGGTSLSGESAVTRYPWGAHYLPVPSAENAPLVELLSEMGVLDGVDEHGDPVGAEHALVREPESRVFYQGFWYPGLYPHAGASAADRAELARFQAVLDRYAGLRDGRGRRAFALPTRLASDDADILALDRLTATEWLDREGFTSPRLRWLVDYACRDDYGLRASATSAWAALFYWVARMPRPGAEARPLLTWPEGNGALVHHLARDLGGKILTGQMVVRVTPREDAVELLALADGGERPLRIECRRCILAVPRFLAARLLALPDGRPAIDAGGFTYGPWMVANLHLRDRPLDRGFEPSWDNVLYESPSLGYVCATHQALRDHGPTVWTHYLPFAGEDARAERARLASASYEDLRDAVLADLARPHPHLRDHLERLDIFRWGHAMIQPRVGFVASASRRRALEPLGRVHFAHSDLSGVALFEEAFDHGVRAADEVVDAERPSLAVQPT